MTPETWTELLPATDAKKPLKRYLVWHTLTGLGLTVGGNPVRGIMELLVVRSSRTTDSCRYVVSELPTNWPGLAFRCAKAKGEAGSDAEAENYDVFVGQNEPDSRCECRGYLHHGHCKHIEAIRALLFAGRLDANECPANPEADTGPTEPCEWF